MHLVSRVILTVVFLSTILQAHLPLFLIYCCADLQLKFKEADPLKMLRGFIICDWLRSPRCVLVRGYYPGLGRRQ